MRRNVHTSAYVQSMMGLIRSKRGQPGSVGFLNPRFAEKCGEGVQCAACRGVAWHDKGGRAREAIARPGTFPTIRRLAVVFQDDGDSDDRTAQKNRNKK